MRAGNPHLHPLDRIPMVDISNAMSWKHIKAVMEYKLSCTEKSVLVALAFHANHKTERCDPSLDTLADYAGLKKRQTVVGALKELEKKGLIKRTKRYGGERGNYTNLYLILHPDGAETIGRAAKQSNSEGTLPCPSEGTPPCPSEGHPVPSELHEPKEILHIPKGIATRDKLTRYSKDAEKIWEEYPRKVGKAAAMERIIPAIEKHGFEFLLKKVKLYAESWDERAKVDKAGEGCREYIPYPSSFFYQERFLEDAEKEWFPKVRKKRKVDHSAGF